MKFEKSVAWVLSGAILLSVKVFAQELEQPNYQPSPPEIQKTVESDAREKTLRDAEELMKAGKPAEAYNLLKPYEFDRSGEIRFDYLFGIAALDSGKPDKATLAFERVLATDPNFAGARLDMARAYYQLGDLPRAKTELETVAKQNPPKTAQDTIKKYLDAIAAQQAAKNTKFTAYLEGGLGHDTNVNNSTSQAEIAVPVFGNQTFTLSPTNLKTSDNYYNYATGGEVSHSLNTHWSLYTGADLRQRGNQNETNFDTQNLDGRVGVSYTDGKKNTFRIGSNGGKYFVARLHNRDAAGFSADWRHVFSPSNQVSMFAQYSRQLFADPVMTINNFTQSTAGINWLHVMEDGRSVLFASLFSANENDTAPVSATNPEGGRADGNKRTSGLRIGGQAGVGESTEIFLNLGYQSGIYDKPNVSFLVNREDRQSDASIGANWHLDRNWTLRPQINYFRNESNIVIYSYDRIDSSLTLRRDFR